MTAKVPTMATGTAISGIRAARQFCKNDQHHQGHQDDRVAERVEDLVDRFADEGRGVVNDLVVDAVGKAALELLHLGVDAVGRVQGVGAGKLVDRQAPRWACRRACRTARTAANRARRRRHVAQADDARGRRQVRRLDAGVRAAAWIRRSLLPLAAGRRAGR